MINNVVTVDKRLRLSLLLGGVLLLAAGSAGASGSASTAGATARAFTIRVVVPGQSGAQTGLVSAPPDHLTLGDGFTYPADGSVATTGSTATSATSDTGSHAVATASGQAQSVSLFGGEITADAVTGKASGPTLGRTARGGLGSSSISKLVVLGQPATGTPHGRTAQPKLGGPGYVFPVYGPVSFSDTYGAFRGDVPGNWHHGDDVFAPLGAPILACSDGIVFSIGWNTIGGNRLWLRDSAGNEFYYAHLSAFSPLAKNGRRVKAGEVLGFVGNTGDAAGTPTHLHFEVHPAALIYLGYDGAVDPTTYLTAWQHLQDVRFQNVAGWVPAGAVSDPAPKPAAILLQVSDISEASGLDPGSLQRAIAPRVPGEGNSALLRALGFRPPRNAGADSG